MFIIDIKPRPPVKWAGGKSQLIQQFKPLFPKKYDLYFEPFFGSGAVYFYLLPMRAVIIDKNEELINFYQVVRDNLEELLIDLKKHKNTEEYYYFIRDIEPELLSPVGRASRFLYLNKTAYNGLWRVNKSGKFNVPYGRYKNPKIVDEINLRLVSETLKYTEILCKDFSWVLGYAREGDFIYFDPPYHPVSETSFTQYTSEDFGESEQKRLFEVFKTLDQRGCLLMLSNSDTEFIRNLYSDYDIKTVYARRNINRDPNGRKPVTELVIRNYS